MEAHRTGRLPEATAAWAASSPAMGNACTFLRAQEGPPAADALKAGNHLQAGRTVRVHYRANDLQAQDSTMYCSVPFGGDTRTHDKGRALAFAGGWREVSARPNLCTVNAHLLGARSP
jgi:hypothetical protein